MMLTSRKRVVSRTVAVFLDWYEPRILKGIARFAKEQGWALLFDYAQTHNWAAIPNKIDGLLALIGPNKASAQFMQRMQVPLVGLTSSDEGLLGDIPRIMQDDFACGRMAAEYFLSLGFTNFLTIGKKNRTFFRNRMQSFVETVSGRAQAVESAWIGESLSPASLRAPIEAALRKMPKPVAIFTPSDVTCVHVMRCALEMGLLIPEEVALLGANNDELICDYAPIPLSSIRLQFTQLGYEGAALLDRVMQAHRLKQVPKPVAPVEVVVRQSTNTIAVPDLRVAMALRFIWTHAGRTLPVEEVALHVKTPQATLGGLFHQHLQRSIVEEIGRTRIEMAKVRLLSDRLPVKKVGEACGFNSATYFNTAFLAATGTTPRKFRLATAKNRTSSFDEF